MQIARFSEGFPVVRSADEMYNNSFVDFWPKKTVNVNIFDNAAGLTWPSLKVAQGSKVYR
jgi:hypothetical protein